MKNTNTVNKNKHTRYAVGSALTYCTL